MSQTLSDHSRWILTHLTAKVPSWDWMEMRNQIQKLNAAERGAILGLMWRHARFYREGFLESPDARIFNMALSKLEFGESRSDPTVVKFESNDAADALKMISQKSEARLKIERAMRVIQGLYQELPTGAAETVYELLPGIAKVSLPVAYVALRAIGDDLKAEAELLRIVEKIPGRLFYEELQIAAAIEPFADMSSAVTVVAELHQTSILDSPLAAHPAWCEFAEHAIAEALARAHAVASGTEPYASDKLFAQGDVFSIKRALEFGLTERKPWVLSSVEDLLRGAALAPDEKVKTVPSQSLSIQIANTVEEVPQPEGILALRAVLPQIRHAGIKKKLAKKLKSAETAFARGPDALWDLARVGKMDAALEKFLLPALSGLFVRLWWMDARDWHLTFSGKAAWQHATKMIWQVKSGSKVFSAIPEGKNSIVWLLPDGSQRDFCEKDEVRLWHPAEADPKTREAWVTTVFEKDIRQPVPQAFREVYELPEEDRSRQATDLFAGIRVAQVPLIGVARRTGWIDHLGYELRSKIGGRVFAFDPGVATYPGAGGEGETSVFRVEAPENRLCDVPARLLSEALRQVDLLVATGAAGVADVVGDEFPGKAGQQSMEMRRLILTLTRPAAQLEGRWLLLGDGYRIHIGTGNTMRYGELVELKANRRERGFNPRGDDKTMVQIWDAISQFGLR